MDGSGERTEVCRDPGLVPGHPGGADRRRAKAEHHEYQSHGEQPEGGAAPIGPAGSRDRVVSSASRTLHS
ncbi:hypothetical protein GCM10027615_08490 [Plantactinospora veratri]